MCRSDVSRVAYPVVVGTNRASAPGQSLGVKLVKGPFVELEPHPDAAANESELARLCKSLRDAGTPLAADLFSGAGGMSLGLEDAGYSVVFGADHYSFAIATHQHHFPGMSVDWDLSDPAAVARVAALLKRNKIELLAGGPPCQPFSKAGRSMIRHRIQNGDRDPHDERRDLWRSFLEVVQEARPPAVIMENVPDMALDREMFILRSMVEELEQEGYSVAARVIDTWKYGVPQMRQRLLLVALRDQVKFEWPAEVSRQVTLWNAIGDMPPVEGGWRPSGGASGWTDYSGPRTVYQRLMRRSVRDDESRKLFDHITRPVREDDKAAFESMTHKTKYTDLAPEYQRYRRDIFDDKYKRLDENDLSRTITAHIAKDGYWYIHPRQPRTLTVREAARIQSFPDDFRFAGPPTAAFKQIGNAVPPLVGLAMGAAIRASLQSCNRAGLPTRQVAEVLADWFEDRCTESYLPWLRTSCRWKFVTAELALSRSSHIVTRSLWPIIDAQPDLEPGDSPNLSFLGELENLLRGIGRADRLKAAREIALQMKKAPIALWEPAIDRKRLSSISAALADLIELAVPTAQGEKESEEPVLITKGVLRVVSRFRGSDADKRNRQTDGRIAVAGMIGLGPRSRAAHLALFELAASVCTVDDPRCEVCPLVRTCATGRALKVRGS